MRAASRSRLAFAPKIPAPIRLRRPVLDVFESTGAQKLIDGDAATTGGRLWRKATKGGEQDVAEALVQEDLVHDLESGIPDVA
jgi:hypothetical protein